MTAANAFSRADGAWLFFDTAIFDQTGFVRRFESKVVADDRLGLAIGACGIVPSDQVGATRDWLAGHATKADALSALPEFLKDTAMRAKLAPSRRANWVERLIWGRANRCHMTTVETDDHGISLLVGWWDDDAHCGRAGVITDTDDLGPKYPPFILHQIENMASPSPAFGDWFDYADDLGEGLDFRPLRDGATLGELERRQPNDSGGYRVGGSFERVHIHAGGIDRATVVQWPDRIGRPIKVAA